MHSQTTHPLPPPASFGPSPRWIALPHKKSWLRACTLGCTQPKIGFWFPARFSSEPKIICNGCKGYIVSEEVSYFAGLLFRLFPGKNRTKLKTLKILAKSKHAKLKYPYRKSRKFKSQKNDWLPCQQTISFACSILASTRERLCLNIGYLCWAGA